MTRSDVSRRTGIPLPTLRWYESQDFLRPHSPGAPHAANYSAQDFARVLVLLEARRLGISPRMVASAAAEIGSVLDQLTGSEVILIRPGDGVRILEDGAELDSPTGWHGFIHAGDLIRDASAA